MNNTIKSNQYESNEQCLKCLGYQRRESDNKCVSCLKYDSGDALAVHKRHTIEVHQELIEERKRFTGV